MKSNVIYETIILGSGPAGLTAAIYAGRSRCCPLLIHGVQPGGQLTTTTVVDNFPGFPQGIEGPKLMELLRQQAERFGAQFAEGQVTKVDLKERPFRIWVGEEVYRCLALIIATGASPKLLGLGNEETLYGRGVSVCATCDGFFYRDREVVVVGGGDTAMEEAVFLTRFAEKVPLFTAVTPCVPPRFWPTRRLPTSRSSLPGTRWSLKFLKMTAASSEYA